MILRLQNDYSAAKCDVSLIADKVAIFAEICTMNHRYYGRIKASNKRKSCGKCPKFITTSRIIY